MCFERKGNSGLYEPLLDTVTKSHVFKISNHIYLTEQNNINSSEIHDILFKSQLFSLSSKNIPTFNEKIEYILQRLVEQTDVFIVYNEHDYKETLVFCFILAGIIDRKIDFEDIKVPNETDKTTAISLATYFLDNYSIIRTPHEKYKIIENQID